MGKGPVIARPGRPGRGDARAVRSNVIRAGVALTVAALALLPLAAAMATVASAGSVGPGTWFEYEYKQWVDDCTDAYYGYDESTEGEGHYKVLSWGPDEARVSYDYSWEYENNEYDSDHGGDTGVISFDLDSRLYTCDRLDLDDPVYIGEDPRTLGQWLWVPPDVQEGDRLWILTEEWTVTDTDATLWVGWTPRKLIEVTAEGVWQRDDDYGRFDYSYIDRLYFDQGTGMFYAERYAEYDEGTWEGQYATFSYFIEIDVVAASYVPAVDWLEGFLTYTWWSSVTVLIVGGVAYIGYRIRWMSRTSSMRVETCSGRTFSGTASVTVRRIRKLSQLPPYVNEATEHFGPYLEHMVAKSLLAGDRVAIAVNNDDLVGIAFYNREAKVGTILARTTEVTETLRKFLKIKDFFSEHEHRIKVRKDYYLSPDQIRDLAKHGSRAYNIFETHKVYRLDSIPVSTYDPSLVRPMTREDLPAATRLAKKVFKTRSRRWIASNLNSGDLAYVAVVKGAIVGFGFACVCGDHGRLHTLAVHPDHRGKGIAKELHRARLEAMRRMGVTTVLDEIADWNLASIRISSLSGFQPVGRMWVETVRTKRVEKTIVRRF